MGFSPFPSKSDDGLTGPSIEALKMSHRIFYGEYLEGPARETRVLVKINSSRRATKRLVEENKDKSMFFVGLDVLVMLRSAGRDHVRSVQRMWVVGIFFLSTW